MQVVALKNQKLDHLKSLIDGSASFNREEKYELLKKIETLNENQLDQAIQVFEEEKARWLELKKTSDAILEKNQKTSEQEVKGIKSTARQLIKQKQIQNETADSEAAEHLLTEI